jgi:hypothetical protein
MVAARPVSVQSPARKRSDAPVRGPGLKESLPGVTERTAWRSADA